MGIGSSPDPPHPNGYAPETILFRLNGKVGRLGADEDDKSWTYTQCVVVVVLLVMNYFFSVRSSFTFHDFFFSSSDGLILNPLHMGGCFEKHF